MKWIIFWMAMLPVFGNGIVAQEIFLPILQEIEQNNTTLAALRQKAEAEMLESRTGIWPENPELGFNYLWGSPEAIGKRTDFNVVQTIDFPSAYRYRNNISGLLEGQAELSYKAERAAVLLEARLVCVDLIYFNALIRENEKRLDHARDMAAAIDKSFQEGNTTILEQNKARLNLANAINDHILLETEANALRAELIRMNGGKEIDVTAEEYPVYLLPADFDSWYEQMMASNPVNEFMDQQAMINRDRERLERALSLPKLSAGYMSEEVVGAHYQGISVGMSIPLWENKNKVKAARARSLAGEAISTDVKLQWYWHMKNMHEKVVSLQEAIEGYRAGLQYASNTDLLKKAYDLGEITLIQYLVEIQFYYDTVVKAMQAQREMHRTLAELEKWK